MFDVELDIKVAKSYNIINKIVHPYIHKTKKRWKSTTSNAMF